MEICAVLPSMKYANLLEWKILVRIETNRIWLPNFGILEKYDPAKFFGEKNISQLKVSINLKQYLCCAY